MIDMFIKLEGIKGEATDSKHKEEIDVLSFHWGCQQSGTSGYGGGAGGGKVQVQDFSWVQRMEASVPVLFQQCCTGKHIPSLLFTARKAGGTQLEYLKIKLTDCMVSAVRPGGSSQGGDDVPLVEVSLNFGKCEIDYQPQGTDGNAKGGPIHGGWNLETNEKA